MKRSSILQSLLFGVLTCVGPLAVPQLAFAQYLGNNFHGDFGVNSGTQSGPGFYVAIPFAQWNADHIKDADGNTLAGSRVPGVRCASAVSDDHRRDAKEGARRQLRVHGGAAFLDHPPRTHDPRIS